MTGTLQKISATLDWIDARDIDALGPGDRSELLEDLRKTFLDLREHLLTTVPASQHDLIPLSLVDYIFRGKWPDDQTGRPEADRLAAIKNALRKFY